MLRYTFLLFLLGCSSSFACLNTYQLKIFPVGTDSTGILTVDVEVLRTSQWEGNRWYKLGIDKPGEWEEMFILKAAISTYDYKQKLVSCQPFDTAFSMGPHYLDTLQKVFAAGMEMILKSHKTIELFTPVSISFCDFQHTCKRAGVQYDSTAGKDYIFFKKKKSELLVLKDSTYYGIQTSVENTADLYISSVRIFQTKAITLVMTHLETGHEIMMGLISSDPKKDTTEYGDRVRHPREHKPGFAFTDIRKSTYEEPLLHHGFGMAVFAVNPNM